MRKILCEFTELYGMSSRIVLHNNKIFVEVACDEIYGSEIWDSPEEASFPATAEGYLKAVKFLLGITDIALDVISDLAKDKDFNNA